MVSPSRMETTGPVMLVGSLSADEIRGNSLITLVRGEVRDRAEGRRG